VNDFDTRSERDLDNRLGTLARTSAPLPTDTRDAVRQRLLAAVAPDATAAHAVEADVPARDRRRRRWIAGGAFAVAAALAAGLWLGFGIEREGEHHSKPDMGGGPRVGASVLRSVAPPVPPPVAHTLPPVNVSPSMLEDSRLAGAKSIMPDDATMAAMAASGKQRFVGSYKICVNTEGNVFSIDILKTTGYPAYDAKIAIEISQWRYKPQRSDVCTAVSFIYSQH
jgi:hypothetical protein